MNFKKEIEYLLNELKPLGYTRDKIETELDYSENYIDQTLAKGGNEKFLKVLKRFRDSVLQNATPKSNIGTSANNHNLADLLESNKLLAQANKILAEAHYIISENNKDLIKIVASLHKEKDINPASLVDPGKFDSDKSEDFPSALGKKGKIDKS